MKFDILHEFNTYILFPFQISQFEILEFLTSLSGLAHKLIIINNNQNKFKLKGVREKIVDTIIFRKVCLHHQAIKSIYLFPYNGSTLPSIWNLMKCFYDKSDFPSYINIQ